MGILDNIKAKLHNIADKTENVEEKLKYEIDNLEKLLVEAKRESATTIGSVRTAQIDYDKAVEDEKEITNKLKDFVALSKSNNLSDDERVKNDEAIDRYVTKLEDARSKVTEAKENLEKRKLKSEEVSQKIKNLEQQVNKSKSEAKDMIVDYKNAEVNIALNEKLNTLNDSSEINRLKDKINTKTEQSHGYDEMSGLNDKIEEDKLLSKAKKSSILDEFGIDK